MRIPLELRCVVFDSHELPSGSTHIEFFKTARSTGASSAAVRHERDLVKWLLSKESVRALLLAEMSLSALARCSTEVREPFLIGANTYPGDIDLLACDAARPDHAIAIEFKRVKAVATGASERVNRLEALGRAGPQVEALHKLGFSRTYLGVIAVVDGRSSDGPSFPFRGLSDAKYASVIEIAGGLPLPSEVGLVYVEIVQPVDDAIENAHMVCVALPRRAASRQQGERITTLVDNFLRDLPSRDGRGA